MWIYNVKMQTLSKDGKVIGKGYSGYGIYKNKPKYEHLKNKGPIPRGSYTIGKPFTSSKTGPYVLPLKPFGHGAKGRHSFQIHGDKRTDPGNASTGCIILSPYLRRKIGSSSDTMLRVE